MDVRWILATLWNRRRALAIVLVLGVLLALFAVRRIHVSYAASASVLMVSGGANGADGNTSSTTTPLLTDDLPMLAQTATVLDRVSRDLSGAGGENLMSRIRANVYEGSNVMTIRFAAANPQDAVQGANAVADEIVRYYRAIATSRYDSLSAGLMRQIRLKQIELRKIESRLERLSAARPFLEDGSGSTDDTSMNAQLVHLQGERDELLATVSGDAALAGVTNERSGETAPLARQEVANADPAFRDAREQYGRDAEALRRDQTEYSSKYPGLAEISQIVQRDRAALSGDEGRISRSALAATPEYAQALAEQNRALALVASDRAKLAQLNDQIERLTKDLTNASSGGATVGALRRERESAEAAYQLLASRLTAAQADRAAAASTGSLLVFDRASFAAPSPYTQPAVVVSAILMAALWVGMTLAFILEALDRRFRTAAAIESVYGTPVLGVIG